MISEETIEQVASFKLLGITVTDSLRWGDHVAAVTAKASKRLWFLKKLKQAGVPHSPTLFTVTKQLSDLSWNMQARSGILASHPNSQKHLKQFSNELVKSLLEAVKYSLYGTAVTVLLLS